VFVYIIARIIFNVNQIACLLDYETDMPHKQIFNTSEQKAFDTAPLLSALKRKNTSLFPDALAVGYKGF